MSLIIPTQEERKQMERERMDIINAVMNIQSVRELHILAVMARKYYSDSIKDLPLPLDVFVDLLELPMIVKLADLFKNEDSKYWANSQIKELLEDAINKYIGAEGEEE